jgi:creatinine amidohydrolase
MKRDSNLSFLDVAHSNWGEIKSHRYDAAILPWGAIEPHNFHLPYLTDCILSYEIAVDSANLAFEKSGTKNMVMPPVYFGSQNPGQWNLPFCIHTNTETQKAILSDIIDSLYVQGLRKMVIVNGHGGNSFKSIVRDLAKVYPDFFIRCRELVRFHPNNRLFRRISRRTCRRTRNFRHALLSSEWVKLENAGEGNALPWPINELNKKTDGHLEIGTINNPRHRNRKS